MTTRKTTTPRRKTPAPQPVAVAPLPRARRASAAKSSTASAPEPVEKSATAAITDEQIRVRAYYLHLERGDRPDPMSDWLRAEQELAGSPAQPGQ